MNDILLRLYNGQLEPSVFYNDRIPEHRKKRLMCYQHHEAFLSRLNAIDPALQEEMEALLDEQLSIDMLELPEAFSDGFRMGAKIMMDILAPDL